MTGRRIMAAEALRRFEPEEWKPGPDVQTEQQIARVADWRSRHVYSEAFLFLDGREPARLPPLLRQDVREKYMASWGVRPE